MINLVIPAAGIASRLRPLSSNMSKIMVRINGKPCLDYIIEQAKILANIQNDELGEIIIVDGEFCDIREYCKQKYNNIKFIKQENLRGPLDACQLGISIIENENNPLVIWLGDAIILDNSIPFGSDCLVTKQVQDHENWCMWDTASKTFYNKPRENIDGAYALVGLYSFSDGIKARDAFMNAEGYDISNALEIYENDDNNTRFVNHITEEWYDIGDIRTYYQTCASLLNKKSRSFNTIEFDGDLGIIRKRANPHDPHALKTLDDEKMWYKHINEYAKAFTPRVFDFNDTDLILSYESGILLSDLMLYDNLSESFWEYIIEKVLTIKTKYFEDNPTDQDFVNAFSSVSYEMWVNKTKSRLSLAKSMKFFNDRIVDELIDLAKDVCLKTRPKQSTHGDLHFGNILYNPHNDQIRFLDPRGRYGSKEDWRGTYGDDLYDYAKLSHDLIFGYNSLVSNVKQNEIVRDIFISKIPKYTHHDLDTIRSAGIILLATAIPLHDDDKDRQQRFCNAVMRYLNE